MKKKQLCPTCRRSAGHVQAVGDQESGKGGYIYTCRQGHEWGDAEAYEVLRTNKDALERKEANGPTTFEKDKKTKPVEVAPVEDDN